MKIYHNLSKGTDASDTPRLMIQRLKIPHLKIQRLKIPRLKIPRLCGNRIKMDF